MFLEPSIDLESLFWKVRFLVKAYRFLFYVTTLPSPNASSNRASDASSDDVPSSALPSNASKVESHHYIPKSAWNQIDVIKDTAKAQMQRLQDNIEGVVAYLVRTFIQPGTQVNPLPLASRAFQSNYYYVMITIWYVVKRCEHFGFTWKWIDGSKSWSSEDCLLTHCLPPDNLLPEDKEREKVALLKWYHYASILNLTTKKKKHLPRTWNTKNLDMKVNRLERDARRAAAAKLSSRHPYSAKDEIIDRLGFLAEPLNAEFSKNRAGSVASITARRILERDYTRYLNPGRLPVGEKGPTSGPWEIHALCYHSRLLVENYQYNKNNNRTREQKAEDVERYRRMISQFLNVEACLVPCWERTNIASFQSEATSVLASTLLSICQKDFLASANIKSSESSESMSDDPDSTSQSALISRDSNPNIRNRASTMDHLLAKLEALQDVRMMTMPTIQWIQYRLPRRYHHDNFFNSLEDTPELYEAYRAEGKVNGHLFSLPEIHHLPAPGLETDVFNVNYMFKKRRISIIDLKASSPGHRNKSWQGYRHEPLMLDKLLDKLNTTPLEKETPEEKEKRLREERERRLKEAKKKLSDSLVDQEVQHRTIILAVPSSMNTYDDLKLFWRAFHVDSKDCFANHDTTRFPDFSCQTGNTWITRITLRSWALEASNQDSYDGYYPNTTQSACESTSSMKLRNGGLIQGKWKDEDAPIEIPSSLSGALRFINDEAFSPDDANQPSVKLKVSSIVLSTNDFGDFSQCTIISELLKEKSEQLGQQCKALWESFIHQPQTGRCLVFLNILGLLCQQMAIEYRESMDYFIRFIHAFEIEKSFTFDENNLLKGTHGLMQLKLGLWSLESLFKLHNSLVTSMKCIEEASTELRAQIHHGPGKRGEILEKICQNSLGHFERRLNQLIVLNDELDQKIKLNSRYKDSLSTVLSLEDSRNSIRQNGTIQKLTYLTIGYLPMGLISAIFAIPSEQNVIIPKMGLGGFVISIIGLFIITFTVAIFIEPILQNVGKLTSIRSPSRGGGNPGPWLSHLPNRQSGSSTQLASGSSSASANFDVEKGKVE